MISVTVYCNVGDSTVVYSMAMATSSKSKLPPAGRWTPP